MGQTKFNGRLQRKKHYGTNTRNSLRGFRERQEVDQQYEYHKQKSVLKSSTIFNNTSTIGKPKITTPQDDLQIYLANIPVVERGRAKFALVDEHNRPLLTFAGEFIYFCVKEVAVRVYQALVKNFQQAVRLIYGPAHKKHGQTVVFSNML